MAHLLTEPDQTPPSFHHDRSAGDTAGHTGRGGGGLGILGVAGDEVRF